MTSYEKHREERIRTVGAPCVLQAEARVDFARTETLKEYADAKTGAPVYRKPSVGRLLEKKGEIRTPSKTYAVPSFPEGFWDN